MAKSPDAFRTISEVAEWLGVEAHVLRFWETKFAQVKPVKRAGGRRYYRPTDMALLGGIRHLLYEDGLTIRGVQKVLREHGAGHVAALSPELRLDGAEPPVRQRGARSAKVDGAGAPTLPIEVPTATKAPATQARSSRADRAVAPDADGASPGGMMLAERIRAGTLSPDPEAARAILDRARAMARRLAERPG
jgi:DNA-binding transcriptional MerR regulator